MGINPRTFKPSTLCPCGHWNDWQRNCYTSGVKIDMGAKKYLKPHICEVCHRQISGAANPEGHHVKDRPGQSHLEVEK